MLINQNMKMSDAIQMNHRLIEVIHRFGISLGFGDLSIAEICRQKKIDLVFFLTIVNAYHDEEFIASKNIHNILLSDLVKYLITTHENYVEVKLVMLKDFIDKLQMQKEIDIKQVKIFKSFFDGYYNELITHIDLEEKEVFPYVLAIEEAIIKQNCSKELKEKMNNYSISDFNDNHSDIEEKLRDMSSIMIKYLNPPLNQSLYHHIIHELFELADDVNHHARIEDKVLIPIVEEKEKIVKLL